MLLAPRVADAAHDICHASTLVALSRWRVDRVVRCTHNGLGEKPPKRRLFSALVLAQLQYKWQRRLILAPVFAEELGKKANQVTFSGSTLLGRH